MTAAAPSASARALLRRLVDYAGFFPPASRSMTDAAAEYAQHLRSPHAWMLGRFIVPVDRLDELASTAGSHLGESTKPWRLSAIVGTDVADAGPRIRAFNASHRERFTVDVVECRPIAPGMVSETIGALPGELRTFVELPLLEEPRGMLEEIRAAGAWAKVRTGGVTPEAFPDPRRLARFIASAAEAKVPFKATAGLHHPLSGEHALTYESNARRGEMFGFLNVFAAAVFSQHGASESMLTALLRERDASAIVLADQSLSWNALSADTAQIADTRASLALSFGSCSFLEPVDGLHALRLL